VSDPNTDITNLLPLLRSMYTSRHYWACGHHATDQSSARRIFQLWRDSPEGPWFDPSVQVGDWLGEGAYFWQEAPQWASEWLLTKKVNRDPEAHAKVASYRPAVIGAIISLANSLDLLDTRWVPVLEDSVDPGYIWLQTEAPRRAQPERTSQRKFDPQNPYWNSVDWATIMWAANFAAPEQGVIFWSVRCPFIEGDPLFEESAIYKQAHVEIAVITRFQSDVLRDIWIEVI
jgi:hypothetical protein